MTLTKDDLGKIKAVVDSGVETMKTYVDRRIADVELRMATKKDIAELKALIEATKEMLGGDYKAVVADYKKLRARVAALQRG
ncbi:hypothetical protein HY374_01255 [Candidatus Berkelbacteria bacterium]|nr:hypothetical protein [Candidatus Berkelbacteria bacterium]